MNHRQELQMRSAFVLTFCAMLVAAAPAQASEHHGSSTEEFHQTYALNPDGRVELDNIDGDVHIATWDQAEVKVDAVKYAYSQERLQEAHIEVESAKDRISIRTQYPGQNHTFNWGSRNNPAEVEYTITVPRAARLDEIKLVNGALDITGASGEVHASSVNGRLAARNLSGRAELSTVNGHLEAKFDQLPNSRIELSSVNGSVNLTIPSDANARIAASSVSGSIDNDFGMHADHHVVGHSLSAELGTGGPRIKISNVNGHIEIRHANDGRTITPAKDTGHRDKDNDDDDKDDDSDI